MADLIDVQVDELRELTRIQRVVNERYVGMPMDLRTIIAMRGELERMCGEAGFEIEFDSDGTVCIVGRTDKRLERFIAEGGPDIERKAFDAKRTTSAELRSQGLDTNLL